MNITNMEQLDKALTRKEHPDNEFVQLQNDYNSGKREFVSLYKLVAKKNERDMEHDQLTEEMVNLAPKDSATSLTFIQFVVEQAPVFDSKAYLYMRKDPRNFNDAWYLMPQQKRVLLNNKMNFKSKRKAIKEKDFAYAEKVAIVSSGGYSDRTQARKNHDKFLMDFYKGINDTSKFLSASVRFYDQFLMNLSVDSLQRVDSIKKKELFEAAVPEKMPESAGGPMMRSTFRFSPVTQYYAGELNDGAFTIYTYTHDLFYNAKALTWAKRATEFFDSPEAMDTYARLLYRTGDKSGAVSWEEKAIQFFKNRRIPAVEFEEVLRKMKTGDTAIDKY